MFLNFVDRDGELEYLNKSHAEDGFHFIVIYGRRRVGKTELIKHFIKDKDAIYFLCDKTGTANNMARFKKKVAEHLGEPAIETNDPEEIFSYFARKAAPKTVLVFDEFAYLIEKDDSVPSVFQVAVDEVLKSTDMTLILCGSSMSMMIEGVLAHKSPLYGRTTGHIRLLPMSFIHLKKFFPSNSIEENVRAYSVIGGVPFYLAKFSDGPGVLENARAQILDKNGALYEETDCLLKEELREPDVYKMIIRAIASGTTRVMEIADQCRIKPHDLDKYLKVLIRLGIVKKESPVTEKKSKKTIYAIDDDFFAFWFRFCEPRKGDLEIGDIAYVERSLQKDFNAYVGKGFEKIVREEMLRKLCPGAFTRVGRWWGHYREGGQRQEVEIDAIGLNEEKSEATFIECKWKELDEGEARKILGGLVRKAAYVEWHNRGRKETYGIFAKRLAGKEELRKEGFLAFDLDDFEQLKS
jgi:AAA+ ATPase superfamily predicted ATPase